MVLGCPICDGNLAPDVPHGPKPQHNMPAGLRYTDGTESRILVGVLPGPVDMPNARAGFPPVRYHRGDVMLSGLGHLTSIIVPHDEFVMKWQSEGPEHPVAAYVLDWL